jgi:hypothetical protein
MYIYMHTHICIYRQVYVLRSTEMLIFFKLVHTVFKISVELFSWPKRTYYYSSGLRDCPAISIETFSKCLIREGLKHAHGENCYFVQQVRSITHHEFEHKLKWNVQAISSCCSCLGVWRLVCD